MDIRVSKMTCNGRVNPLGIDGVPVLSWQICSDLVGDHETAFRLSVSKSEKELDMGDFIFDSGKICDDGCSFYELDSIALKPRTRYYWQIEVFNAEHNSVLSPVSYFETGKLNEKWSGYWIGAPFIAKEAQSHGAPYFLKVISCDKNVADARLFICGLGYYEPYINGVKVTEAMLEPAFTKFDSRVLYSAYDVTPFISCKEWIFGVMLGNGWYNYVEQDEWNFRCASWKGMPRFIAEIHLTYEDGTSEIISSNESFKAFPSPLVYNCLRNGETYDATKEVAHWCERDFNDSDCENAIIMRSPGGLLVANETPQIKIMDEFKPVKYFKTDSGSWVFDFGQNMAGVARLKSRGKKGTQITMVYGERLSDDGQHVSNSHIDGFVKSGDFQTARYIIGEDDVTKDWMPVFSYYGFRYVELIGETEINEDTLTACLMHSSFERHGNFECSEELFNKIQSMCHFSTVSNSYGVPTDCPHREKNSWSGDSAIYMEQMFLNFDSKNFYKKWLDDIYDSQRPDGAIPCIIPSPGWGFNWGNGPDWSKAIAEVPYTLYLYSGDTSYLSVAYPYIKACFDSMVALGKDYIVDYGIGDWCAPFEGKALSVNMSKFKAPRSLVCTVSMYYVCTVLDKIEKIMDYDNPHEQIAKEIKQAINKHFYDPKSGVVKGDCQTSYAFALYFDLVDDKEKMLEKLIESIEKTDYHLDYGIVGSKFVLQGLGEHGRADVIYKMLKKTTYPSYGYLTTIGRTTLAECWNGTGSQNHNMFSDVSAVFYKCFAGIVVDEKHAGFKRFTLKPQLLNELSHLDCDFDSPHGKIAVKWERNQDGTTKLIVTIPFGTTADFALPEYVKNGDSLPKVLGSGTHMFILEV